MRHTNRILYRNILVGTVNNSEVFTSPSSQKQFHFRNPEGSRYFVVCGQYYFDFYSRSIHFAAVLLTFCAGVMLMAGKAARAFVGSSDLPSFQFYDCFQTILYKLIDFLFSLHRTTQKYISRSRKPHNLKN